MKSNLTRILIVCLTVLIGHDMTGQQQWPMAGGCKERTSWASEEDELYPPFNHISSFLPDYALDFHSLSILNNIMCAGISGTPNKYYGIDMTTRDTLWSFAVPKSKSSVQFTAAQNDTLVFVGGHQGAGLFCLDRFTGEEKWFRPTGNLYTRNVILDEDRLYFNIDSLYCIDAGNGDTIWTRPVVGQTTAALDESNCYVTGSGETRAFNKLTGEKVWGKYNSNYFLGFNILDELNLYTCSNDSVIARNKEDGGMVWGYRIPDVDFAELTTGNMAVDDHVLAVSIWNNLDTLGQIYVLDKSTGDYKWHYTFGDEGALTPTIANHVVYVVSWREQKLYGFDADTGELLLEEDSYGYKAEQPVVYNHMLYIVAAQAVIELGNNIPSTIPPEMEHQTALAIFPNPGAGLITIEYMLAGTSTVSVTVFSLTGARTDLLTEQVTEPGRHTIKYDSSRLLPGVYFCEARIIPGNDPQKVCCQRVKFVVTR